MSNMKKYFLLVLLFISFSGYAQNTLNNYKYVLVPERFNFLKEADQYGLNSQAKTNLEEKGFTVYFDNSELPSEIANNRCSALVLEVLEKNSMFSTNLTLVLKDCKGNVLFKGKEGKSREKEYRLAYNFSLKAAFTSLNEFQYAYNGAVIAAEPQAVPQTVPVATIQPAIKAAVAESAAPAAATLYAQPTAIGFQLVDATPKIILTLSKTSVENYFIAAKGNYHGIVFKKNESWVFEYYDNNKLMAEVLSIKF